MQQILRSMGSRRTSQTCCINNGHARGWITPSRWHSFVLQKTASRRTRIEMEWQIKIDRFSRRTKTASAKRIHATPYSSAMPLIVYVRVRPQSYRYLTAHKPNVSTLLATEAQTQRGFIEERTSLAPTHRCLSGDLSHATGRHRQKRTSARR